MRRQLNHTQVSRKGLAELDNDIVILITREVTRLLRHDAVISGTNVSQPALRLQCISLAADAVPDPWPEHRTATLSIYQLKGQNVLIDPYRKDDRSPNMPVG